MKKCVRCGKNVDDDAQVCECGFDFHRYEIEKKYLSPKEDPVVPKGEESSLIDNPILTFIFGILSMALPIFVFSLLAFRFASKPSKVKLEKFQKIGNVFAYIGVGLTLFIWSYILIGLIWK